MQVKGAHFGGSKMSDSKQQGEAEPVEGVRLQEDSATLVDYGHVREIPLFWRRFDKLPDSNSDILLIGGFNITCQHVKIARNLSSASRTLILVRTKC